jgi:hypothetical protein
VAIIIVEYARGVRPELIRYGSQVAFIPIWFLAVYIMIMLLVPALGAAEPKGIFPRKATDLSLPWDVRGVEE